MVNTYAAQSGGCRFESLWGFGFSLKGAYYEVGYCGKKTFLAGLQCTLTSSCAKKVSQCRKTERGALWDFPTSILTQIAKKIDGGTLWGKNFPKKSLTVPKKIERGDPLVSPGMVCYAEKQDF